MPFLSFLPKGRRLKEEENAGLKKTLCMRKKLKTSLNVEKCTKNLSRRHAEKNHIGCNAVQFSWRVS